MPSGSSRRSCAVVLLAILFASVIFGLNLGSAKAQNANLDRILGPSVARAGEEIGVTIYGSYESSESMSVHVVVYQRSDDAEVARGSAEIVIPDDDSVHHGEWSTTIGFTVYEPRPEEYNDVGEYVWELRATLHGFNSQDFSITILEPNADPRIRIARTFVTSMFEMTPELDPATDVFVGGHLVIWCIIDYSFPEEAAVSFYLKNNLGIYPPELVEDSDGWMTGSPDGGPGLLGSSLFPLPIVVTTPLDPVDVWEWQFRVEAETLDGRTAEDTPTLAINVQEAGDRTAHIYLVISENEVSRGESFDVEVTGVYIFPGDARGDLQITIEYPDGTPIVGGETYTIPDCVGRGPFDEVLTITAPDAAGDLTLYARLRISGKAGVEDEHDFDVEVFEVGVVDDTYCRITGVLVNGAEPPQQVTPGESFTVDVQLEWNVIANSYITVLIWDWDRLVDVIGFDQLEVVDAGVATRTISISIPAFCVPPRNGMWTLRAAAYYGAEGIQFTADGYERTFQVEVVGAEGIAGGTSDWAVTGVWASPVDPFLGTDVAFTARIQVNTADPLPQTVTVAYSLDGLEVSKDPVAYEDGMAFLSVTSGPWVPTLGEHTIRWEVDPDHDYDDPNPANNVMEVRFSVSETPLMPAETEPPTEPPPSGEAFDFYVTAVPTEQTISSPVTYTVTVDVTSGTPEPIQLELMGAPAGASYLFTPPSGTPSYTSTLTITTASDLPAGTYQLTIKAVGGGKERYKPITLKVEKGPEYSLTISPNSAQAKPAETATFAVVASSENGYSQYVNLIVSGLPSGVTYKLDPPASTPPFESTLTLQVGRNVQPGVYRITITGSGADSKRTILTLRVAGTTVSVGNEATVDYLAAGILAAIIAVIAGVAAYAVKKFRTHKAGAFCIECGTKLSPGTEFCPSCGSKQVKKEA